MSRFVRVKRRGHRFPGAQKGNLEELVAHHIAVQNELGRVARRMTADADAKLASHRDSGDSKIEHRKGRIDHYVDLDDRDGAGAAAAIEFGRKGYTREDGTWVPPADGVHALSDARSSAMRNHRVRKKPRRKEG